MFSGQTKPRAPRRASLPKARSYSHLPAATYCPQRPLQKIWSGSLEIFECVVTSLVCKLCKNILSREINLSAAYFSTALGSSPHILLHQAPQVPCRWWGSGVGVGGERAELAQGLDGGSPLNGRSLVREPGTRGPLTPRVQRDLVLATKHFCTFQTQKEM